MLFLLYHSASLSPQQVIWEKKLNTTSYVSRNSRKNTVWNDLIGGWGGGSVFFSLHKKVGYKWRKPTWINIYSGTELLCDLQVLTKSLVWGKAALSLALAQTYGNSKKLVLKWIKSDKERLYSPSSPSCGRTRTLLRPLSYSLSSWGRAGQWCSGEGTGYGALHLHITRQTCSTSWPGQV